MKGILPLLLIFFFYISYGQTHRDTIRELQREKEQESVDLEKCNNLKNDFKGISFKSLEKLVANGVIFRSTKNNVIINYRPPFSKHTIVLVDPFDYTPVYCNYRNPAYNQSDFWNEKTVKFLQRKSDLNIIPYLPIEGEFINRKTVKFNMDTNDKAILVFLKQRKIEISDHINADKGEKYYFIPAKGFRERKLNLNDKSYQEFEINFRNYLGKIVTVKYIYGEYKEVYKTYQYKLKNWIEIPTKDEYKF